MSFDLNAELKHAQSTVTGAVRIRARLAAVGVTPREIAATKSLLAQVVKNRKAIAGEVSSFHQQTADKRTLIDEADQLVGALRKTGRFILDHDQPADARALHDQIGIGQGHIRSAEAIATWGNNIVAAVADARWSTKWKRRGVKPAATKRLGEIAAELQDTPRPVTPTDQALPPLVVQLVTQVRYLCNAASLVLEIHSAAYAPFRPPVSKRKPKTSPTAPATK